MLQCRTQLSLKDHLGSPGKEVLGAYIKTSPNLFLLYRDISVDTQPEGKRMG